MRLVPWFGEKMTRMAMGQNGNNENLMRQIDENLRRVYRDEAAGQVPDKFLKLLEKLKEQDTKDGA